MLRVDRIRPPPDAQHFPVQFQVSQDFITHSNINNIFTDKLQHRISISKLRHHINNNICMPQRYDEKLLKLI